MSALFWVRIVRISSLVGSSRRCQAGRPYSPASRRGRTPRAGPVALEALGPRPPGVRELALARSAREVGAGQLGTIVDSRRRDDGNRQPRSTSRASRSPQRSTGVDARRPSPPRPSAGARRPGTATAPTAREGLDPVGLDPATDRDARHARLGGPPRDAQGGLAEAGLGVDPALAGDDEVGVREPGRRSRSPPSPGRRRDEGRTSGSGRRSRAARTRRRRRRRRPACRGRRAPVADFERVGPGPRGDDRARRRRAGTRPSAARRSPPRRMVPGAGSRRRRRRPGRRRRAADRGRPGRRVPDRGRPWRRAPSSSPAPPSVVALPPIPRISVRAPASSAARSSSPVPLEVAATRRARAARRATGRTPRPSRGRPAGRPRRTASAPGSGDPADR